MDTLADIARDLAGFAAFGLLAVAAVALFKLGAASKLGAALPAYTDLAAFL